MKLELSVYAVNLSNVAGLLGGKSDPFAVVTVLATQPGQKPIALGKTETIHNNLNPKWVKVFILDYELGTPLKIAVNLFDEEKNSKHKSMGSALFDVAEVLGSRGNTKVKKLKGGGTVFATVRKSVGSGSVQLQLRGNKLKNVDGLFSKSDPFFELSRKVENAGNLTWDNVYRSTPIMNNLNPNWTLATIDLSILCGGDLDAPILIQVFDFESSGSHKLIGMTEMSVNGMKEAAKKSELIRITNKNKDCGQIAVDKCEIKGHIATPDPSLSTEAAVALPTTTNNENVNRATQHPQSSTSSSLGDFIDYVSGGCELNVMVAIDFTGSNGDPRKPGTLHYLDPTGERNDYQKSIAAVVSILSKYDSDQKFPVVGFGAKYNGIVRHCFQCGPTDEAVGVSGVLDAYSKVFSSGLIMSSPTLFHEVIDNAAQRARKMYAQKAPIGQQSYSILLIVTDGAVSDVPATISALDRANDSPLSIVIVGVGSADFTAMQFLDDYNDNSKKSSGGHRSIVQFVEFNKHRHNSVSLTSATLDEIPNQLSQYFSQKGIRPLPPIQRGESIMFLNNNMSAMSLSGGNDIEEEIDLSLDIRENDIYVTGGGYNIVDAYRA